MVPRKRAFALSLTLNALAVTFAVILGLSKTGNPSRYFGEGRFTTGISCFQLLLTAFFCAAIFRIRSRESEGGWCAGHRLWMLVATGFVFLAVDDAFQLHERMDGITHKVLAIEQNALTDRIDDAIIGIYALIGIWVLWMFRRELRAFSCMLPPLIVGFLFTFVSVICDTVSNRGDVSFWITGDLAAGKKLEGWFAVGDGAFTLLAEGMFIVAFYYGWSMMKSRAAEAASVTQATVEETPVLAVGTALELASSAGGSSKQLEATY